MKELSIEEMEMYVGGSAENWLEGACIFGGIALSIASGGWFAAIASVTIHACIGYMLTKVQV